MNEAFIFGVGVGVALIVSVGIINSSVFASYKKSNKDVNGPK